MNEYYIISSDTSAGPIYYAGALGIGDDIQLTKNMTHAKAYSFNRAFAKLNELNQTYPMSHWTILIVPTETTNSADQTR